MREVRKLKAKIICILVMALMIASVAVIPAKVTQDDLVNAEINKANVVKLDASIGSLSLQGESMEFSPNNMLPSTAVMSTNPAFNDPGDQTHPAIIMNEDNDMAAGYHDEYDANITMTWSTDYGQTWAPGILGAEDWDYPTGDLWGGSRVFGTGLCNPNNGFGGWVLVYDVIDPTDPMTWNVSNYAFLDLGWYNQKDVELACDNSQDYWEWGVSSYVFSSTYEDGYTDGPTVVFADPDAPGTAWINWWYVDGCAHTDVDIDPVTHQMYAVYDWYNTTSEMWDLLIWTLDFTDPSNQDSWELHEITGDGNLQYPVVAVYNNNLVILAETDENGNSDIICYYSDDGVNNLQTVFVADSGDNELYPDIQHNFGQRFVCTYVASNNLYASITEDGGANWADTRWQINENNGAVVEEYKTSDLCEKARMAVWEENHDDIDCYIGLVYNQAPGAPTIEGPANGKADQILTYTFNAVDPDGDDVRFIINWGDSFSDTTNYTSSGLDKTAYHIWGAEDTYTITASAEDSFGNIGSSTTFTVVIPRSKILQNTLFQQLLERFPNTFPVMRHILGL